MQKSKWFPFGIPEDSTKKKLFCFHCAGGNAISFKEWTQSERINIIPVEIPGRGVRIAEQCVTNIYSLLDELFTEIVPLCGHGKYYLFGHSMGALLAFQIAYLLEKKIENKPQLLIVAGRQPPHIPDTSEFKSYMGNAALHEELVRLGGTPEGILENKELFEFLAPMIRSDYMLHESYQYKGEKISIPIIAHAGKKDLGSNGSVMKLWKEMTSAKFEIKEFEGSHFFIHDLGRKYVGVLEEDILKN